MSTESKILIIDQVGLDRNIFRSGLSIYAEKFHYLAPNELSDFLARSKHTGQNARVLLLVDALTFHRSKRILPFHLERQLAIVVIASREELDGDAFISKLLGTNEVVDVLEMPVSANEISLMLRRTEVYFEEKHQFDELSREFSEQRDEMKKLNEIGIALSVEQDITRLLDIILTISMELTGADGASLYLVEEKQDTQFDKANFFYNKQFRFRHAKNFSREVPFKEMTMPITPNSIAGYAALSHNPINLPDVYFLSPGVPYSFGGRGFDQVINYRTKSMLVVPMLNREQETIGVIQLMNKKSVEGAKLGAPDEADHLFIPFSKKDENLIYSLASQAAVAYENRQLYDSIQTLFEGFIKASVTAIESRDPTTSGHSERVALFTVGLAETLNKIETGTFKDLKFSAKEIREIKYASLLHDFGKIGVRENVLIKSKKLYETEIIQIKNRFEILRRSIEGNITKKKLQILLEKGREEGYAELAALDKQSADELAQLDSYLDFIIKTNEPTVLKSEGFGMLQQIRQKEYSFEDFSHPCLTDEEVRRLSIPKGSLDDSERKEIESHVVYTYRFLKQIPWTNDLRNVPEIAYGHHEKLDGTGYPQRLAGQSILIQSQMMSIADIYDALTARDRPYKPAVPVERALDILRKEFVDRGQIDRGLFDVFVDAKVYVVPE
ncbi:MAG: HD domain-containing phosphohydrolase [Chloroherpetonaceae bacterium]|nr:HD domain-containing phosphohydrolase [Chloroherpetonaceae bacterium]